MPVISVATANDNGSIQTIEKRLESLLPRGSCFLKNPEGTDARSDQLVKTFREDWAKKQHTTAQSYKDRAAKRKTVCVQGNIDVGTVRRNLAEALGIPAAALVFCKPKGLVAKDNIKVTTFRGYWSKMR